MAVLLAGAFVEPRFVTVSQMMCHLTVVCEAADLSVVVMGW